MVKKIRDFRVRTCGLELLPCSLPSGSLAAAALTTVNSLNLKYGSLAYWIILPNLSLFAMSLVLFPLLITKDIVWMCSLSEQKWIFLMFYFYRLKLKKYKERKIPYIFFCWTVGHNLYVLRCRSSSKRHVTNSLRFCHQSVSTVSQVLLPDSDFGLSRFWISVSETFQYICAQWYV